MEDQKLVIKVTDLGTGKSKVNAELEGTVKTLGTALASTMEDNKNYRDVVLYATMEYIKNQIAKSHFDCDGHCENCPKKYNILDCVSPKSETDGPRRTKAEA